MRKIIDVSEYNGPIDWAAAATACDGAVIRIGYRGWGTGALVADRRGQENLRGAVAAGLPVGVYFVTQAVEEAEAIQEARWVAAQLDGHPIRLPVCLDDEPAGGADGHGRRDGVGNAVRTRTAIAFVREIARLGYQPAIYCANSWFSAMIDGEAVRDAGALVWISSYPARQGAADVAPTVDWDAWQYSPWAVVPGVGTECDVSWYKPEQEDEMTLDTFAALLAAYRDRLPDGADWSAEARAWAVDAGLFEGTGPADDPQYRWGDFVTREQLAMVLYRLAGTR